MSEIANTSDISGSEMMKRAVILQISFKRIGVIRRVPVSAVKTEAAPEMIGVHKLIFESPEFDKIKKIDAQIRRYIETRVLPSPLNTGSFYLLPIDLVDAVDSQIEAFRSQRDEAIEKFIEAYPKLVDAAEKKLGPLFNLRDYPPVAILKDAFSITTRYTTFSTPSTLSAALFQREKEKAEKQWMEAAGAVQDALRVGMAKLVENMVDRLGYKEDGKPKIFRDSLVGNMADFLDTFQSRNLVGDKELESLVSKAKKLLDGVDPENLRSDEALRSAVSTGFTKIQETLSTMCTVERPARKFAIDDEAA